MAHGNTSDLVFLALLVIAIQFFAFPATLFQDLGPLKAQFDAKSQNADVDLIIKFGGCLILMHGLTLSGVKWNPINGKMAGLGGIIASGYTAFSTFRADSHVFVPRLFYVYSAVLLLGALHIFLFPSNPLPEKTSETKNNHGNFSDLIFFALAGASLACFFYPDHLFMDLGPIKAQFKGQNAALYALIKLVAGLMLTIALTFSGVKWNPINGKMAGLGGFIAAGFTAFSTFRADSDVFVPRVFYIYSVMLFLGALHIFAFPSNPLPPKPADDKKKMK